MDLLETVLNAAGETLVKDEDIDSALRQLAEKLAPREIRIALSLNEISETLHKLDDLSRCFRVHESEWPQITLDLEREHRPRLDRGHTLDRF